MSPLNFLDPPIDLGKYEVCSYEAALRRHQRDNKSLEKELKKLTGVLDSCISKVESKTDSRNPAKYFRISSS